MFLKEHLPITTFLDPRFTSRFFKPNQLQLIVEKLKDKVEDNTTNERMSKPVVVNEAESDNSSSDENLPLKYVVESTKKKRKISAHKVFWESHEEYAGVGSSSGNSTQMQESPSTMFDKEIKRYNLLPVIPRTDNPFVWWSKHKLQFLCCMVKL